MKKINFIAFLADTKESYFDRIVLLTTRVVVPLYIAIIISIHSIQGYKWYQISKQKSSPSGLTTSFDNAVNDRAQLQQSKQALQGKILFLNQHKKDSHTKYEQLKNLYYNPAYSLTTATVKGTQFSLSLTTQISQKAHEFLKALKLQPLIHKARIVHLHKNDSQYFVEIKGKFRTDKIKNRDLKN